MRIVLHLFLFLLLVGKLYSNTPFWKKPCASYTDYSETVANPSKQAINNRLSNLPSDYTKNPQPLGFQENKGQITDDAGKPTPFVLFKTELPNLTIWLTTTGLTYQFFKMEEGHEKTKGIKEKEKLEVKKRKLKEEEKLEGEWQRVDMVVKNAVIKKENIVTENDITQGTINYYLGHCPNGIFNVKTYAKITIKEIYKGIDWVLYTDNGKLKHDFIVWPEADPMQIKLLYEGSGEFEINDKRIHLKNNIGELTEGKLMCYQNSNALTEKLSNETNEVNAHYTIATNHYPQYAGAGNTLNKLSSKKTDNAHTNNLFSYEVSVMLDNYNTHNILVIDPQLEWATYFGGSDQEYPESISIDNTGAAIIVGLTDSHNFPVQNAGSFFQGSFSTGSNSPEAFILKYSSTNTLLWSTYYGGSEYDEAFSVTTDNNNNIYLSGLTSSPNFPTQNAGTFFQGVFGGGSHDGFILKFDNLGNRLWATFYGGSDFDALTISKSIIGSTFYVTGSTSSTDFPTQNNGGFFQGAIAGDGDAAILKFDTFGNRLWATYCGGTLSDGGISVATDPFGNVFVGGSTTSTDFPTQNAGTFFQATGAPLGTSSTCFILKFDSNNNRVWSTYYGGNISNNINFDQLGSLLCDNQGNVFVTGITTSTDFPLQNAGTYFQNTINGDWDAFVVKFDNIGNRLWATYYGGNDVDGNYDSALDECGNLFLGLGTVSSNMVTQASCDGDFIENTLLGGSAIYVTEFSNTGLVLWSTYINSTVFTVESRIAVRNHALILSSRNSSNMPLPYSTHNTGSFFDNTFNGAVDLFICKFTIPSSTLSVTSNSTISCNCISSIQLTTTACAPYNYNWSNGTSELNTNSTTHAIANLCSGAYQVTVTSIPSCTSYTANFILNSASVPLVVIHNTTIINGQSIEISVTNSVVATNYTWTPSNTLSCANCPNPIATPSATTIYSVSAIDMNGCTVTSTVEVFVKERCSDANAIHLPNAFSPNGDGANDGFCIQDGQSCIQTITLAIYNRWGEKIFETNNPAFCWDGTYKGKLQDSAVFIYISNATFINGESIEKKGNITLIR